MAEGSGNRGAWNVVLGVLLGTIVTALLPYWNRNRELDIKLVEIAIGVLRAEPNTDVAGARGWAIRVINEKSGIPFSQTEQKELIDHPLPFTPTDVFGNPSIPGRLFAPPAPRQQP
jgi:hypothetical protein